MRKESFVFYRSWVDAIKDLPDNERLSFYEATIEYGCNGNKRTDLSPLVNMAFKFVKASIDKDKERYDEICKKRSEAGKKHRGNQYTKKG